MLSEKKSIYNLALIAKDKFFSSQQMSKNKILSKNIVFYCYKHMFIGGVKYENIVSLS